MPTEIITKPENYTLNSSAKTNLAAYNNDWFKKEISAGFLKQFLWYLVNSIFFINSINFSSGLKIFLLKLFGAKIGNGVVIKPGVNIKYPWKLSVGDYTWIGENVWIDNLSPVTIGSNVCLSQGAFLLTGNHNYKIPTFDLQIAPIILEDGVWIGAKTTVCPGVTCRSHSVLSVGSIATKDMEAYTIYQGNPAVEVRKRVINNP